MKESRIVENTNQYTPQNIKIATHRGELLGVVDKLKNKYDGLKDTETNRKGKVRKGKTFTLAHHMRLSQLAEHRTVSLLKLCSFFTEKRDT